MAKKLILLTMIIPTYFALFFIAGYITTKFDDWLNPPIECDCEIHRIMKAHGLEK